MSYQQSQPSLPGLPLYLEALILEEPAERNTKNPKTRTNTLFILADSKYVKFYHGFSAVLN